MSYDLKTNWLHEPSARKNFAIGVLVFFLIVYLDSHFGVHDGRFGFKAQFLSFRFSSEDPTVMIKCLMAKVLELIALGYFCSLGHNCILNNKIELLDWGDFKNTIITGLKYLVANILTFIVTILLTLPLILVMVLFPKISILCSFIYSLFIVLPLVLLVDIIYLTTLDYKKMFDISFIIKQLKTKYTTIIKLVGYAILCVLILFLIFLIPFVVTMVLSTNVHKFFTVVSILVFSIYYYYNSVMLMKLKIQCAQMLINEENNG